MKVFWASLAVTARSARARSRPAALQDVVIAGVACDHQPVGGLGAVGLVGVWVDQDEGRAVPLQLGGDLPADAPSSADDEVLAQRVDAVSHMPGSQIRDQLALDDEPAHSREDVESHRHPDHRQRDGEPARARLQRPHLLEPDRGDGDDGLIEGVEGGQIGDDDVAHDAHGHDQAERDQAVEQLPEGGADDEEAPRGRLRAEQPQQRPQEGSQPVVQPGGDHGSGRG